MAKKRRSNTGIPGLSFLAKRALGITRAKQKFARSTGIPTTKAGWERKVGRAVTSGCLSMNLLTALIIISTASLIIIT